jgi:hypothetical protein
MRFKTNWVLDVGIAPARVGTNELAMKFFYNLAALWNLLLLATAAIALFGFLYWFALRRLLRARRIAHARDRRMLREAAEREASGQSRI